MSTIRFLKPNLYRKAIGETDSQMSYGVHDTLVRRGIAEFVDELPPVVSGADDQKSQSRNRKRRDAVEELTQ